MDQLKRLRTEKGLSQAKLAALADIDPSTVNQIERGAREPSPATLRKLAQALDVSLAELLEDASPKAPRRSSLEPSLFNGLEDEWRSKLQDIERGVQYIIGRAEYWKQELERGRETQYKMARSAENLAILAVDEFSNFNEWIFGVVPHELNTAIDNGEVPDELVNTYNALIDRFVEHIVATQHMLFENAAQVAKIQGEATARLDNLWERQKAADSDVRNRRPGAKSA
jgi:transcriptional regulator with XRE-family HTH domain